jgi:hypothetical protein
MRGRVPSGKMLCALGSPRARAISQGLSKHPRLPCDALEHPVQSWNFTFPHRDLEESYWTPGSSSKHAILEQQGRVGEGKGEKEEEKGEKGEKEREKEGEKEEKGEGEREREKGEERRGLSIYLYYYYSCSIQ